MKRNSGPAVLAFCLVFGALAAAVPRPVPADSPHPTIETQQSWDVVWKRIQKRFDAIGTVKMYFREDWYYSPAMRSDIKSSYDKSVPGSGAMHDPNQAISYFWAADKERWRTDRFFNYPARGFSQMAFDGEKYYVFDGARGTGYISGSQGYRPGFFTQVRQNVWFGSELLAAVDWFQTRNPKGAVFELVGHEPVAGVDCEKWRALFGDPDITCWISTKDYAILKVALDKPGGAKGTFETLQVASRDGVTIPVTAVYDAYDRSGNASKASRAYRRVFHLDSCEVNRGLGSGYFTDIFRVGTQVEDRVKNPGAYEQVGGGTTEEARRVEAATIPPPVAQDDQASFSPVAAQ